MPLAELAQRLFQVGAEALEAPQLLRILIGAPGAVGVDARRAAELLARFGLDGLARVRAPELLAVDGVRRLHAARIGAAFELARRAERVARPERPVLRSPARVHAQVARELAGLEREVFLVLLLDSRHRLRRIERVSEGTLTSSLVHPREFFCAAVREAAAAVIAVHNHPSGDPTPSSEDVEITRRLRDAGRLLGVPLLDHVIIGGERYESLRERLQLPMGPPGLAPGGVACDAFDEPADASERSAALARSRAPVQ
ncbi:MAG: DNA repair protein RadC [Planctomycetota bacterium]|nr:MAG: DNA repair protein RadC [Planctomycetota bacterium]